MPAIGLIGRMVHRTPAAQIPGPGIDSVGDCNGAHPVEMFPSIIGQKKSDKLRTIHPAKPTYESQQTQCHIVIHHGNWKTIHQRTEIMPFQFQKPDDQISCQSAVVSNGK